MNTQETSYPTKLDNNGYFLENLQAELMQTYTKENEDGTIVKKVILKNGKVGIVRELDRSEMKKALQISGDINNDNDKYLAALISVSTKIDDKEIIMEDILNYKAKDFIRLSYAVQSINF